MTRRTTRKRRSTDRGSGRSRSVVRGRFLTRLGAVLGAVAVVGIAYVWLMNETYQLGFAIEAKHKELRNLERRNAQLELRVLTLESPAQIHDRIRTFGLGLQLPDDGHTALVWEPMDNVIEDEETRLARLQ